jgi:uncharacterized protein (TIGR03083 family)
MGDSGEARRLIGLLRVASVAPQAQAQELGEGVLEGPSYCSEWTVAQVFSHLGSGAEIFARVFAAAASGGAAPGREDFSPIWEAWNAKGPTQQARDYVTANSALLDQLERLDDGTLAGMSLDIFGATRDTAGLVRMRLNEQVLHAWDVAVALDPAEELFALAVPEILAALPAIAGWAGKATGATHDVAVHTVDPSADFLLSIGEHVSLRPGAGDGEHAARLELPAAALIRLVYGRLDPDHTPQGVGAADVEMDDLRAAFPGT